MTDRRRYFFVLLFVAALVIGSGVVLATKPTKLGLDLRGGVQLTYKLSPLGGQELTPDSVQRTIDVMQDRVNQYGVAEAEIQQSGSDQIDVSLPDVDDPAAAQRAVGTTAQLAYYDWEASVVGPGGVPAPSNNQVTGSGLAVQLPDGQRSTAPIGDGTTGESLKYFDAVRRAAKFPPRRLENAINVTPQWYLIDEQRQTVQSGPESTLQDLRDNPVTRRVLARSPLSKTHKFVSVPAGYRIVQAADRDGPRSDSDPIPAGDRYYILLDQPALRGTEITDPAQTFAQGAGSGPVVSFQFTDKGRKAWESVTKEIAQRGATNCVAQPGENQRDRIARCSNHFAIVLDNQLVSVPSINYGEYRNGIRGGGGAQISGNFTIKSAQRLADLLKSGSLPLKVTPIASSQVSSTLGAEALDQALVASIVGFAVVALFLLAFYRVLGLVAVLGLGVYTVMFLALVKLVPIVMTLPGIAGLILTIAVAADANVVIFERVKDELQAGRPVHRALKDGYRKGLSAIIDGNVITFLVAFILFLIATSGVKGFALNLGLGVIVSMVTAVVLTQAVLGLAARSPLVTHPTALGARTRQPIWHRFDFVGKSRYFFAASGVILAIGAFGIGAKGLNFGIDFESGTRVTATARAGTSVDDIRQAMDAIGRGDAKIQEVSTNASGGQRNGKSFQIATEALDRTQLQRVTNELQQRVGVNPRTGVSSNTVGPTFGQTVARLAVIAVLASFAIIAFVIWFRFGLRFTAPILIAVIHDLLITAGIYALTGAEITASTVAALLTIIGYSLYDTIIVFDRVRENLGRLPSAAFSQIVNRSMSEVLGRSLVTSFSTGLPVLALLLFGGETLQDFALAMLVGTLSGAYSSVFIASPVLADWMERSPKYAARRRRLETQGPLTPYPVAAGAREVEPERRSFSGRVTTPDAPGQEVSGNEFRQMVDELGVERSEGAPPPEAFLGDDDGDGRAAPVAPPTGRRGGTADGSAPAKKRRVRKTGGSKASSAPKGRTPEREPTADPDAPATPTPPDDATAGADVPDEQPASDTPAPGGEADGGVQRARDLDPEEVVLRDDRSSRKGKKRR